MMRSRLSSKNSASRVLFYSVSFFLFLLGGCTSSTTPTFVKENIEDAVRDIALNEYQITLHPKLIHQTLWIYMPLENIITRADKPEKYVERFAIDYNNVALQERILKVAYHITLIPEEEKMQEAQYDKDALEKINKVWRVLRRVTFSMDRSQKSLIHFVCIVTADIKNGFLIKETVYAEDLKKVSYGFISWDEFQHRVVQDSGLEPSVIDDTRGISVDYHDITMEEFIVKQIQNRIRVKFQKPEAEKNADRDKEITRAVAHTLQIYKFYDFDAMELYNMVNEKKTLISPEILKRESR